MSMQYMNLSTRCRRLHRWLFHRGGHGVHSPFAFSLIKEVVEPRYPYYYRGCPMEGAQQRELGLLLFRLVECSRFRRLLLCGDEVALFRPYLEASNRDVVVMDQYVEGECYDLVVTDLPSLADRFLNRASDMPAALSADAALVMLNIHTQPTAQWWGQTIDRSDVMLSFDLVTLGILYPHRLLNKHNYRLYF